MRRLRATLLWRRTRTHAMAFTRRRLCGRFLLPATSALVPPRVGFTTEVGTEAPNICIERRLFYSGNTNGSTKH